MVCSSCGFDNPAEHRYCGICGTPFPHRPLTVPDAQSTLSFSSTRLEIAPLSTGVAETPLEPDQPQPEAYSDSDNSEEVAAPYHQSSETADSTVPAAIVSVEAAETPLIVQSGAPSEASTFSKPDFGEPLEGPRFGAAEPVPSSDVEPTPELVPRSQAPSARAANAVETSLSQLPMESSAVVEASPRSEPQTVSAALGQTSAATHEPSVRGPEPFLVPKPAPPAPPGVKMRAEASEVRRRLAVVKPPIPEVFTPPPASAGMPTFREVTEAAGVPGISPFEAPTEQSAGEDQELKEFVANFRYTPPEETADELTMRSEVPVIDQEAPAKFHHPSFDGDELPPQGEVSHSPVDEHHLPGDAADRSRFLDISDVHVASEPHPAATPSSSSFLGLDAPAPSPPLLDESVAPPRRHWGLWSLLAGLLVIFGGLGYLGGRAQTTHAFRAPLEIAHTEYAKLGPRLSQMKEAATAAYVQLRQRVAEWAAHSATPAQSPSPASTEQRSVEPPPASPPADQTARATNPSPENSGKSDSASSTPAPTTVEPQSNQSAASAPVTSSPGANAGASKPVDTTKAEPTKPIEAPPPASSSKPQPGQQELAKAMDARDSAAAAAWLWKATSRGNPVAPVRLADMYIKGQGVPRSCEQALVLLRSAATKENAPARNRLAALYANGTCVARDRVRAYELMSSALAADPGSEWAKENRQQLWNQMTPPERAEAQKFR